MLLYTYLFFMLFEIPDDLVQKCAVSTLLQEKLALLWTTETDIKVWGVILDTVQRMEYQVAQLLIPLISQQVMEKCIIELVTLNWKETNKYLQLVGAND